MNHPEAATVHIIDDDPSVREAMAWLLRTRRLLSQAYASAAAFEQALALSRQRLAQRAARQEVQARVGELTERERAVMERVAGGLANKRIADELGISVRTVEVHRARVFEKMDVKSAVELANLLQKI